MYHRSKQFQSFIIGCLASLMVFGYPARLLASTSDPQEIQGVTSTYQEAPATIEEVQDAQAAVGAGLEPIDALEPKPVPLREYTAFLVDVWDELFTSEYMIDSSYIQAGEWLSTPTGMVEATNENNEAVDIDVTLSLEFLPSQFSSTGQDSIDLFSSVSARMGMAWATLTNASENSVNVYVLWVQQDSGNGPHTLVFPLDTVPQADLDLYEEIIPNMDGFFDSPFNYNIDNYDPSTYGIWSTFRSAVRIAVIAAVAAVVVAAVPAVATVIAASSLTVMVGAVVGYAVTAAATAAAATAYIDNAVDNLRDDLADHNFDVSNATDSEVIQLGKIAHLLGV